MIVDSRSYISLHRAPFTPLLVATAVIAHAYRTYAAEDTTILWWVREMFPEGANGRRSEPVRALDHDDALTQIRELSRRSEIPDIQIVIQPRQYEVRGVDGQLVMVVAEQETGGDWAQVWPERAAPADQRTWWAQVVEAAMRLETEATR